MGDFVWSWCVELFALIVEVCAVSSVKLCVVVYSLEGVNVGYHISSIIHFLRNS